MAERPTITPAMLSQEKPLVKIGHYVLGETLGVGTFGKVKSMTQAQFYIQICFLVHFCCFSWRTSTYWSQGGN